MSSRPLAVAGDGYGTATSIYGGYVPAPWQTGLEPFQKNTDLAEFLEVFEYHARNYGASGPRCIEAMVVYLSPSILQWARLDPAYRRKDWQGFKESLGRCFPSVNKLDERVTVAELMTLINAPKVFNSQQQLASYVFQYQTLANNLLHRHEISNHRYNALFFRGLPQNMRNNIEARSRTTRLYQGDAPSFGEILRVAQDFLSHDINYYSHENFKQSQELAALSYNSYSHPVSHHHPHHPTTQFVNRAPSQIITAPYPQLHPFNSSSHQHIGNPQSLVRQQILHNEWLEYLEYEDYMENQLSPPLSPVQIPAPVVNSAILQKEVGRSGTQEAADCTLASELLLPVNSPSLCSPEIMQLSGTSLGGESEGVSIDEIGQAPVAHQKEGTPRNQEASYKIREASGSESARFPNSVPAILHKVNQEPQANEDARHVDKLHTSSVISSPVTDHDLSQKSHYAVDSAVISDSKHSTLSPLSLQSSTLDYSLPSSPEEPDIPPQQSYELCEHLKTSAAEKDVQILGQIRLQEDVALKGVAQQHQNTGTERFPQFCKQVSPNTRVTSTTSLQAPSYGKILNTSARVTVPSSVKLPHYRTQHVPYDLGFPFNPGIEWPRRQSSNRSRKSTYLAGRERWNGSRFALLPRETLRLIKHR